MFNFEQLAPVCNFLYLSNLFQVGYPSQTNSLSCEYARIDFDCDEEFSMLLSSKFTE